MSLTACSSFQIQEPPTVITETKIVNPPKPIVSTPDELTLRDISFIIVTKDNVGDIFANIKGDKVLFAISVEDYEKLALNLSDIRSYIQQQKEVIILYENVWKKDP